MTFFLPTLDGLSHGPTSESLLWWAPSVWTPRHMAITRMLNPSVACRARTTCSTDAIRSRRLATALKAPQSPAMRLRLQFEMISFNRCVTIASSDQKRRLGQDWPHVNCISHSVDTTTGSSLHYL